ncbi:hypothetical protein BASA50_005693 [Batrachochytrium salamandrivorans]|uniref:Uncharacterized protein n=1 Tax=Batrachochytrium salamandrivorans TaxID=1357716 RepID=A0ABQ8FF86_9FUNG|nr:hypothetical protein BASA50_005693 [Batrachochytrium salamandrivorans]KAH9264545.1 hypothetical protein BASA83_011946 [Batrachochytrium salamandrivorans]
MIYTSYARLAIIVALLSESAATPVAQDQTSVHLEKRTPQGDIEDAKMSLPGSSAGGLHGTSPKGAISKSQSKSSCRGSKCKLPRMTLDEFLRRDMDLKFINTDGELERTFSNYARVVPYAYKDYLIIIKQMEISNKKRKAEEKKAAAANKKKETAERKETKEVRKQVDAAKKRLVKTNPRILISDKQALQKWREVTKRLTDALKSTLLVSKGDLEGALAGSSSETDATGRSQVPRAQAKKLYISRFGVVSFVETRGSRENPTSDKAYFKLLSTLSDDERTEWGLKPKSMLP